MNDKEFVLVSQGIEIYRTKSQENAVNIVKKENDEYFDYCQKCYNNYEKPADNYIDLEIEYSSEKDKDKEIERLNNIINELDGYLDLKRKSYIEGFKWSGLEIIDQTKDFLQELKGEDKNTTC